MIILTHPNNLEALKAEIAKIDNSGYMHMPLGPDSLYGMKIEINADIQQHDIEYKLPPEHRFYAYDVGDLPWLKYCGWAVVKYKPIFYLKREDYLGAIYPMKKSYKHYK